MACSRLLTPLLLGWLIAGTSIAQPDTAFVAEFDPAAGVLPYPSNLLFTGSTDGTLNIPVADPGDPASASLQALNQLDGFSTVAPLVTRFSSPLDPDSVRAGDSVRLYRVDLVNPFLESGEPFTVETIEAELVGGEDFQARLLAEDTSGRTLEVLPLRPLDSSTGYLVALTDELRALDGRRALPDLSYIFARYRNTLIDDQGRSLFARLGDTEARALEPLRRQIVSQEDAIADWGLRRANLVLSWTFLTQSTDEVLHQLPGNPAPRPLPLQETGLDTGHFGLSGLADLYAGNLRIPYYLEAPTLIPTVILTGHWTGANDTALTRYNPHPVVRQMLSIPVLASVPNAASGHQRPAGGWPVVIFQHGLNQDRTNLIAIADALATTGLAAVAIDAPLHGVTDIDNPLYRAGLERTFNVDLIDNATGAAGPDGLIDPSGVHFLNLNSLLTFRDNLRQGTVDLLALAASLSEADLDGDNNGDFNPARLGFAGHSLGGIIGGTLLGVDNGWIGPASLVTPGGGIARMLEGSGFFGPRIRTGLEAIGILPDTPGYAEFFRVAQQVLDSADPLNFATVAADRHPIHMIELIDDDTIPNRVQGAPLAGTHPLTAAQGLTPLGDSVTDPAGLRALVRFLEGQHASLISGDPPAAAAEMQRQMAEFLASGGTILEIADEALIEQP